MLMSSPEDTPANRSASPENEPEKTTHDTCGPISETPLASYDPDTHSWKTYGVISLWGDSPSLETLPPSGMTQNGELFRQLAWVPIIDATDCSLLHTPTATMNQMAPSMNSGWWPTPTAVTRPMEGNVRLYRAKIEAGEMSEEEAEAILGKSVWEAQGKIPAMWPTPTARDSTGTDSPADRKRNSPSLPAEVHLRNGTRSQDTGRLNPMWVEWLMGFPLGWTDLED